MLCPACHKQNSEGAKFCAKCVGWLLLSCQRRGAEPPSDVVVEPH